MARKFALDHEVKVTSASATFKDGVLELVLPKKAEVAGRRVNLQ